MLSFSARQRKYMLALYMLGLAAGTFLFLYMNDAFGEEVRIYGNYLLETRQLKEISMERLSAEIIRYRIRIIMILILLYMTPIRNMVSCTVIALMGVRYGLMISFFTVINQKQALLYFLRLCIPHELIYIVGILMMTGIFCNLGREFWHDCSGRKKYQLVAGIVLVFVLGILSELYVNPVLWK